MRNQPVLKETLQAGQLFVQTKFISCLHYIFGESWDSSVVRA